MNSGAIYDIILLFTATGYREKDIQYEELIYNRLEKKVKT